MNHSSIKQTQVIYSLKVVCCVQENLKCVSLFGLIVDVSPCFWLTNSGGPTFYFWGGRYSLRALYHLLPTEQLQVERQLVIKGIQSLSDVFLECAKRNLSESDFVASVAGLNFNEEHQKILAEVSVILFVCLCCLCCLCCFVLIVCTVCIICLCCVVCFILFVLFIHFVCLYFFFYFCCIVFLFLFLFCFVLFFWLDFICVHIMQCNWCYYHWENKINK